MPDLFDTLRRCLEEERLVALATVLAGPAPVGAKVLIYPDGTTAGSLGAPDLDAAVARDAVRAQRRQESVRRPYPAALVSAAEGEIDVFTEVYAPSPHLIAFGEVLCVAAGLPPMPPGVVALPRRRAAKARQRR